MSAQNKKLSFLFCNKFLEIVTINDIIYFNKILDIILNEDNIFKIKELAEKFNQLQKISKRCNDLLKLLSLPDSKYNDKIIEKSILKLFKSIGIPLAKVEIKIGKEGKNV